MSTAAAVVPVVSRLIESLPRQLRGRLLEQCQPVELASGAELCTAGEPLLHAFFPLSACISLLTALGTRPPLDFSLIGNEGMLGATLALGVVIAPLSAVVLSAGTVLRIPVHGLQRALRDSPDLRRVLNQYLYVLMAQSARSAACIHFHQLAERLARWLLMTHDRVHGDHFKLTHRMLADMLGVRRSGVTIAAGALQARKLISYSRGGITVLNRRGLEAASCECYRTTVNDYSQFFRDKRRVG
jgi:CRP-like cAMP-binding protein